MSAYAIAGYLPLDARRAACALTYRSFAGWAGRSPRSAQVGGYCPLGAALAAMTRHVSPQPTPAAVATQLGYALYRTKEQQEDFLSLVRAAEDFERDWDACCIPDLYDALGVPRPEGGAA